MGRKVDVLLNVEAGVAPAPHLEWTSAFADHLRSQGRSASTVKAYLQDVRGFSLWCEQVNGCTFTPDLTTGVDLRGYRQWAVEGHNMAPATWNRRRVALSLFCAWAQAAGHLNYNPFQGVEAWEEEELPPRWLDKTEFSRFMRQVELITQGAKTVHWKWQALRDQAMIALMAYAGLREGEVVGLNLKDVSISERSGRVIVWTGKGDKKREVPLGLEVRRALGAWLEVRGSGEALFIGKGEGRLTTRSVQRRVAEIGRQAGLTVTPHDLRHTFAKRLVDAGKPLSVVGKLLGHARLDTTARYAKPGWKDLEEAVE